MKCTERRAALMADLGDRCARCSSTANLQFDCIAPKGSEHHGLSLCDRLLFYERQHTSGNLQLLCSSCNQRKAVQDKIDLQRQRTLEQRRATAQSQSPEVLLGPMPSPSDWKEYCAWHARKNSLAS
jgi:5-methylcytosine-specific restriction endonuclease McrA